MPVHHATDAQTLNAIIQQVRTGIHGRGRLTRLFVNKSVYEDLRIIVRSVPYGMLGHILMIIFRINLS